MRWGGLNPALTAWRGGILTRFPRRGSQSDGGYADGLHASTSQHQKDSDGTVDAFDCDVNFLGSSIPSGSVEERAIAASVKADFEADRRSRLWIHDRTISSRAIGPWRDRAYGGSNPHDKHIHFEAQQALERDGRPWPMPRTDALLAKMRGDDMPDAKEIAEAVWDEKPWRAEEPNSVAVVMQRIGPALDSISSQLESIANRLTALEAQHAPAPPVE